MTTLSLPSSDAHLDPIARQATGCSPEARQLAQHQKLRKAARDFESILIASWWDAMGKSFPDSTDENPGAGMDTLKDLSRQAMALAVAEAGGLGISRLMLRQLEPAITREPVEAVERRAD